MKKLLVSLLSLVLFSYVTWAQNFPRKDTLPQKDTLLRPDSASLHKNQPSNNQNIQRSSPTYRRDSLQHDDVDPKMKPGSWRDTIPKR
jgi:hypothetical protein